MHLRGGYGGGVLLVGVIEWLVPRVYASEEDPGPEQKVDDYRADFLGIVTLADGWMP